MEGSQYDVCASITTRSAVETNGSICMVWYAYGPWNGTTILISMYTYKDTFGADVYTYFHDYQQF